MPVKTFVPQLSKDANELKQYISKHRSVLEANLTGTGELSAMNDMNTAILAYLALLPVQPTEP